MLQKEPALVVSTAVAFLTAILGCAAAFGFNLDDTQRNAVIGVVAPTTALLFLIGPIIRSLVYSPNTVKKKVAEAAARGAAGEVQTPVVP